jgi:PAS domain S-box-containing protein
VDLGRAEYQTLVEQAPILIWRANVLAECDYFNERWLAFRGRTLEQEYGNGWASGVHPEDFDRCLNVYLTAFHAREVFEMEYRLMRHDGVYRWLFDRGVPFETEDGRFAGYIGSCVDVTDRVEAQHELEEARQREMGELRSLVPMCSYCKKINADGDWLTVEAYLRRRAPVGISHGMCPSCLKEACLKYGFATEDTKSGE